MSPRVNVAVIVKQWVTACVISLVMGLGWRVELVRECFVEVCVNEYYHEWLM